MLLKQSVSKLLLPHVTEAVWGRGQEYTRKKKVANLKETEDSIDAVVKGTKKYSVHLYQYRGQIEYVCTCPHYERGSTCKHIVAVAVARDQKNGFDIPQKDEVKNSSMINAPTAIKKMYEDPLNVNLDHLREASDWGNWTRPHAKLPKAPAMKKDTDKPLKVKELETVFSRIEKWTYRRNYDLYFCAGEVVAGFCEVLDVIRSRSKITPIKTMQDVLLLCMKKADVCVLEWIDDSNGIHVFLIARLKRMISELEGRCDDISSWKDFREKVESFELGNDIF